MEELIAIDFEILARAVSDIDHGCASCITNFLNKIPLDSASKIASWINENEPVYEDRKLFLDEANEWDHK